MSSLAPLLERVSKKHRVKANKYSVDPGVDASSPYGSRGGSKLRKKTRKVHAFAEDGNREDTKKCDEYEEALRRRDFRQVLWMIMNGDVPANYESKTGETALLAAVSAKNIDALAMLMTCGVSIDTPNQKGYTPLMKAIAVAVPDHNPKLKPKLLPVLPSNNSEDLEVTQDLNIGVFDNGIVENVLAHEPNLLQTDRTGRTAFDWAKLTGNTEALQWLEKRQKEKSIRHQSSANRQERVVECTKLLQLHEEYSQRIEQLIAPQFFDEAELVAFLKGATLSSVDFLKAIQDLQTMNDTPTPLPVQTAFFVNVETREGWTPLTKCAAFGYVAGVQELLAKGADLHHETRLRHTAMTWASFCGHEAVVLHLLRIGVDVNQKTRDGKTALVHAISNSQPKIVHHLLIATRDQCFPDKPIETFSSEVDPHGQILSKRKPDGSSSKPRALNPVEVEWPKTFLKQMRWQDKTHKDAIMLAQHAVEQAGLVLSDARAEAILNDSEMHPAIRVFRQVETAIKEAEEHKLYVETHADRTKLATCQHDGCSFMAPKDVLPTHEHHHCTKRTIKCDNCSTSLVFEDRSKHDMHFCPMRRVTCTNFQYGCQDQMLFQDRDHHITHHCRKRDVQCRLLCGATVRFDELNEHESSQCHLRLVECELGCHATFTVNFAKTHRIRECPKRMIPCARKDVTEDGCGAMVRVEEMEFHLSTLCELRELPCKWLSYGCNEKTSGVASARHHHEANECRYRLVSCRNGCELSGQFLACFAEEHYRWQCMLEKKKCPNNCLDPSGLPRSAEVLQLPEYLMMVHHLQEAGDCPLRKAYCPLDLCGKRIRLFDTDQGRNNVLMSGNCRIAQLGDRATSLKATQAHVGKYKMFLARLGSVEHIGGNKDAAVGHEAYENPSAIAFLVGWLEKLLETLVRKCDEIDAEKNASARVCRILTFDSSRAQHLIEFPDGHSLWISLSLREYDVVLPNTADGVDVCIQYFRCGLLEAKALKPHIEEECSHRLVECPFNCGQRLPMHSVELHLSKGCNMRNGKCQHGCGEVMSSDLLAKHEQEECKFRSVFCEYCHLFLPVQAMSVHLDNECQNRPRGCKLGCTTKVSWTDTVDHESNLCPKRLIHCRVCQGDIWFCEREIHENDECPLRVFGACEDGCGQTLRYNEVAHHLLFSCTKRIVDCKQCKLRMRFEAVPEHQSLLCSQRVVTCRKGCGVSLKEAEIDTHESEECPKRLLFCQNHCGLHVPCCEMDEHLKSKCSMRVMECPTGCREWIFAFLFEDHWKRCRQRIVACGVGGKLCARPIRMWHQGRKLVRCAVHGESALLWALKAQDMDLVTYMLQNVDGSNGVNEEFANGFSPLVLAASLGNVDLVQLLLRFGADVNFETSRGRTPLSEACIAQDPVIVKLLIDNRASVSHTNRQGKNLIEMVHEYAASSAGTNSPSDAKWKEIIQILEEQATLERDQRDLFIAIACSNYDHLIQCFKYSSKPSHLSTIGNPAEALQELVDIKQKQAKVTRMELEEAVQVFNESIAETEAKRVDAVHLSSQVDDGCRRLQNVEKAEEASDIDSNALEADMLAMIREITAQDIAQLLNSHVPSETSLVVVKALSLLCGAVPRGRRNATEYTDVEWWKTAQALLMDRSLLRRLRGYRQQEISPDVMSKVRRECLKTPAFAACAAAFKANREAFLNNENSSEAGERNVNRQIPPVDTLRGNIVGILATWIQGVEIEYKARSERQVLVERKRQIEVALNVAREKQQHANFEAQVEARSLPARQEEVEVVRHQCDTAEKELEVAKKRLNTYKLLNYAALSGHTPLTFACAVGNEAIVHMLLSHGASSGHHFEEQVLCASFIQVIVRDYQHRKKFEQTSRLQENNVGSIKPRSDAAIEALVRNVAHTFIVGHYKRKLVHFRQTHRVVLHEAVLNGYPEIAAILLSKDARPWQNTYVLPERVYPGALLEEIAPVSHNVHEMVRRRGKWKLHPLVKDDHSKNAGDEHFNGPMSLMDTLKCALKYYDSRLFKVSKGWESPGVTFYSATAEFITELLEKREAERHRWQKELAMRRNAMKKTAELKGKHTLLEVAIVSRDFIAVSRLLDDGAFADYETNSGALSALMASCVEEVYLKNEDGKDVLAVEYLLDRTMNRPLVNFESSNGMTALKSAAFYGTMKCAQVLIERGASLNFASRLTGCTALMVAADNRQEAFVRFLLAYPEANVFLHDSKGKTALDYARNRGFVEITGLLSAAMGGSRGRMVSSVSGIYGVCKWGCGYMTSFEGHLVQQAIVVKDTNPLEDHELHHCPKRHLSCRNKCGVENLWAEELKDHMEHVCELRLVNCPNEKCTVQFTFQNRMKHLQDECELRVVLCECGESMIFQRYILHAKMQCPMRLVPCPLQCMQFTTAEGGEAEQSQLFQLRWQDVKAHVTGNCPHRNVRCRNGCTINDLLQKDRARHETTICLLRRARCKWRCKETVLAGNQATHELNECDLRQQSCPSRCGRNNIPVMKMGDHISKSCSRRLILCSLGCGCRVPMHTMDIHVAQDCKKRIVVCTQCDQSLLEDERQTHQSTQCPNRLTVCGLCGQTNLTHAEIAKHRKDECRMRQVTCKYQCFVKLLLAHEKERHEMWECAFRPIWCPLGCGEVFICNTLKRHQRSCSMRFVVCRNGCGEELREKDRVDHEQNYCSLNKVHGYVNK